MNSNYEAGFVHLMKVAMQWKLAEYTYSHTKTMPDGSEIDIAKLVELMEGRHPESIPLDTLTPSRSTRSGFSPKRYDRVDTTQPVVISSDGLLLDGRHRILRLRDEGLENVMAHRSTPEDLEKVRMKSAGLEKTAIRATYVMKTFPGNNSGDLFGKNLARHNKHMPGAPLHEVVQKQYPKAETLIRDLEHVDKTRIEQALPVRPKWDTGGNYYSTQDNLVGANAARINMTSPSAAAYAHELRHAMQYSTPTPQGPRLLRDTDPIHVKKKNVAGLEVDVLDGVFNDDIALATEVDANRYALSRPFITPKDRARMAGSNLTYAQLIDPDLVTIRVTDHGEDFASYLNHEKATQLRDLATRLRKKRLPSAWDAPDEATRVNIRDKERKVDDAKSRVSEMQRRTLLEDHPSFSPFNSHYWNKLNKVDADAQSKYLQHELTRHKTSVDYIRNNLGEQAANDYNEHVLSNLQRVAPEDAMARFRGLWNEQ